MKTRSGIRPLRVETLLSRQSPRPSDLLSPQERHDTALVRDTAPEFSQIQSDPWGEEPGVDKEGREQPAGYREETEEIRVRVHATEVKEGAERKKTCLINGCQQPAVAGVGYVGHDKPFSGPLTLWACQKHLFEAIRRADKAPHQITGIVKAGADRVVRTCRYPECAEPATRAIIWADGRAAFHVCENHVGPGIELLKKKNGKWAEIAATRRYDPDAPRGQRMSSLKEEEEEERGGTGAIHKTALSIPSAGAVGSAVKHMTSLGQKLRGAGSSVMRMFRTGGAASIPARATPGPLPRTLITPPPVPALSQSTMAGTRVARPGSVSRPLASTEAFPRTMAPGRTMVPVSSAATGPTGTVVPSRGLAPRPLTVSDRQAALQRAVRASPPVSAPMAATPRTVPASFDVPSLTPGVVPAPRFVQDLNMLRQAGLSPEQATAIARRSELGLGSSMKNLGRTNVVTRLEGYDPRGIPLFNPLAKFSMRKAGAQLRSSLLPHQQRVIERIREQPGLVVAHGTGSGKTLSSLGAIVDLNPDQARVLVPAALQENYRKEIQKHVRGGLPIKVESLQKAIKDGRPPRADVLVVDEAHHVRNPQSKGYQLLQRSDAGKRLLLTASPVYNQPEDIATLVNLAAGGKALREGSEFRQRYVQKPGRGLLTTINPWAQKEPKIVRHKELGDVLNRWVDYHGSTSEGFPELVERRVDTDMTRRQSQLHDAAWGELPLMTRIRLRKGLPPDKQDLARINRFQSQSRQISSSERKYVTDDTAAEPSPKILAAVGSLKSRIETDPEHRAVVYANYLGTLNDYSDQLTADGVPHAFFRGDTPRRVREQNVRDYNEGRLKALLVSGAGGEGLDLKGTRQVQVLEPHWNEEKLQQVIGRARRLGSHDHLPPEQRVVEVERYAARPLGFFGPKRGVEDILYDTAAQKQRLNDQVLGLIAGKEKGAAEFAPGIPAGRRIKPIPKVKERAANQEWTVSLSKHPAAVRGDHLDLRLVDPTGKAHSWAFNQMPEPGKGTYAAQQATHSGRYAMRTEPFVIPPGYGATRPGAMVEPQYVQPAEVISANQDRVHLVRHEGQRSEELVLKRIAEDARGTPLWALRNVTRNLATQAGQRLPIGEKPKYRQVSPDQIDLADETQVMTPKVDGAHVLVNLEGPDHMARVYSYRQPKRGDTGLIEHTFKLPDFQNLRGTPKTKGTLLRAELYATDAGGKAIPVNQLGGLLNSTVLTSREKQKELGVRLRLMAHDVVRHRGKTFEDRPYAEKQRVLEAVQRATKGRIEAPLTAVRPADKAQLLERIRSGQLPMTREGVVLRDLETAAPPTKAVFRPDHDVVIRGVLPGKKPGEAGALLYSWDTNSPVVGRVGTGFSQSLRKEMMQNSDRFVGRVARVRSAEAFQNRQDPSQLGALRAPSFQGWHLDKTDPELMKEGGDWGLEDLDDQTLDLIRRTGEVPEVRRAERLLLSSVPRFNRLRRQLRRIMGSRKES